MPEPAHPVQPPHGHPASRHRPSSVRWVWALGLCYMLTAVVSLYLSRQPGSLATIWYANAVAMAWIAFSPWRQAPLLVLAMATGRELAVMPPALVDRVLRPADGETHTPTQRADLYFEAMMKVLDRDLPGYAD